MKKTFYVAVALLILAACSKADTRITGEWKLISYGNITNPIPAILDIDTSIKFDAKGQMNGNVGCNGFGGNYEMSGDKITFDSIISTMMYCEKTSSQEQGVLGVFSDNVELQIQKSGDTLTITSADGASLVNLVRK